MDAITDAQIIVIYRGVMAAADEDERQAKLQDDSFNQMDEGDSLMAHIASEVRDLATRDPERVKSLVASLLSSPNEADQQLASRTARGLASYDYPFARNALIQSIENPNRDGVISELAVDEARVMMRDDLTQDQITDFNAHLATTGSDRSPVTPALPDERHW